MSESKIYAYKRRSTQSHFTLDNGKHADHNDAIDLDKSDLERPLLKEMAKEKNPKKDRLIKVIP